MNRYARPLMAIAVALLFCGGSAMAGDINNPSHLTNSGNNAINNVKARQYNQGGSSMDSSTDSNGNSYDPNTGTLVHMGNARKGDCTMNVGGVASGRETVVSAKNIVNVCK